jgi:hypothetical protein
MTEPSIEILCGCSEHLDKVVQDIVLPSSAKKIYEILFGKKSSATWEKVIKISGGTGLFISSKC